MAYVVRHASNEPYHSQMLYEADSRSIKRWVAGRHDQAVHGVWFEPVSASFAHRWVRQDAPHSTGLWIDSDNRIRRS